MLAVRRSLRNSDRLIFPSLSMSASSSSGSIDPFKPVCCILKENLNENTADSGFHGAILNICIGGFLGRNPNMFLSLSNLNAEIVTEVRWYRNDMCPSLVRADGLINYYSASIDKLLFC